MPKLLRCPHCTYTWPWMGRATYRTTCPQCHGTIYLEKGEILVPLTFPPDSVGPGDATIVLAVWNGDPTLLLLIRSDDDQYDLHIPIDPAALGERRIDALIKDAVAATPVSGEYPLTGELLRTVEAGFALPE